LGKEVKSRSGTRPYRRKLFYINLILFLIPATYLGYQPLLRYFGSIVVVDEPPRKSDAILILAGGEPGRAWEAADLYNGKLAEYVIVTKDEPTHDEQQLRNYGIELVDGRGNYIRVLRGLGVPEDRIVTIDMPVQDTFTELQQVRNLLEQRKWKSLIIVTSNYHTRRARLTARYVFGPSFDLTVVASKHGGFDPDAWWRKNNDVRTFLIEFQKLVAYTLYIWPRLLVS
jgi:uncharacterized SAM-binding protein YcdF (DUF218 family)